MLALLQSPAVRPAQRRRPKTPASLPKKAHDLTPRPERRRQRPISVAPLPRESRHQGSGLFITPAEVFTFFGFVVAAFLVLAFGADFFFARPFLGLSPLADISFAIFGVVLAYLSWDVYRDQRRGRTQ